MRYVSPVKGKDYYSRSEKSNKRAKMVGISILQGESPRKSVGALAPPALGQRVCEPKLMLVDAGGASAPTPPHPPLPPLRVSPEGWRTAVVLAR